MSNKRYASVWDAIEGNPARAGNASLMIAVNEYIKQEGRFYFGELSDVDLLTIANRANNVHRAYTTGLELLGDLIFRA